ncbi:hypothetical protein [Aeromicrobium sp. Leaf350]|uniref:hypothetical protein n=1 Tax=Aeromicrobium sp. Leaf350 TaxID=2876565 RepID=UPI001E656A8D|nr:hypothetical protein [Aeromicrobium sp. Leaf350]
MRLLCGLVVAVLLVTGCSGGDEDVPRESRSAEPDPDRTLSVQEIEDAMLRPANLSEGFEGAFTEGVETSPAGTFIVAASDACEDLWGATQAERYADLDDVEALFFKTDLGPFLHQHVIAADEATVTAELDRMATATEACPSYTTEEPDGHRTAVEFHQTIFPEVGDRSVTIERGITRSDGTNHLFGGSTTVFIAIGPHLMILTATHYVDQEQFATDELEEIVATAIERLEDART